jgi:hypothetical protein
MNTILGSLQSNSTQSFGTSLLNMRSSTRQASLTPQQTRCRPTNQTDFLNDFIQPRPIHFTTSTAIPNSKLSEPALKTLTSNQSNATPQSKLNLDGLESIELIKINKSLKSKVYSSYLIYSAANPFSSNFDFINKQNPEFYETLSKEHGQLNAAYRFNRANSSLSFINNYLEQKKIESYLLEQANGTITEQPRRRNVPSQQQNGDELVESAEANNQALDNPATRSKSSLPDRTASSSKSPNRSSVKGGGGGGAGAADLEVCSFKNEEPLSEKCAENIDASEWTQRAGARKNTVPLVDANLAHNQFLNYRKEITKKDANNISNTCKFLNILSIFFNSIRHQGIISIPKNIMKQLVIISV